MTTLAAWVGLTLAPGALTVAGGYDYTFAGSSDNITRIQWYQDVGQAITRASA